ncbi:hypothetical protein C0Q70_02638 [Pomacea canaliculata]|uniref:C2H2-type domain-containing protein n=1 Tax=Pomacea canaliculata TaxID=400727 RepID=A0A2T7PQI2_POMCA|nr:hypothetical protein C0Q70_02638 [Pomacea canaliculata]
MKETALRRMCTTISGFRLRVKDTDPRSLELQELERPTSLSLSYVLRYFTDAAKREQCELQKKRVRAHSPAVSLPESTPTGSEVDDEEMKSDDEDSDDSWTTQEELNSDTIMSMVGCRERVTDGDRPYACPVPGCKKRYKNVNGIKYHARNGHKKESKIKKSYKCFCGKSYKSLQGLRNHSTQQHPTADLLAPQALTLNSSLLSTRAVPSPPSLINVRDVDHVPLTSSASLETGCSSQLAPSMLSHHKIITQVKTLAMAAGKGQGQSPAALSLPFANPVHFISRQPASAAPVSLALKGVKLESSSSV